MADAFLRTADDLQRISLPLACDVRHIELATLSKGVDKRTLPQRAGDDGGCACRQLIPHDGVLAADGLHVAAQSLGGDAHHAVVGSIEDDGSRSLGIGNDKRTFRGFIRDFKQAHVVDDLRGIGDGEVHISQSAVPAILRAETDAQLSAADLAGSRQARPGISDGDRGARGGLARRGVEIGAATLRACTGIDQSGHLVGAVGQVDDGLVHVNIVDRRSPDDKVVEALARLRLDLDVGSAAGALVHLPTHGVGGLGSIVPAGTFGKVGVDECKGGVGWFRGCGKCLTGFTPQGPHAGIDGCQGRGNGLAGIAGDEVLAGEGQRRCVGSVQCLRILVDGDVDSRVGSYLLCHTAGSDVGPQLAEVGVVDLLAREVLVQGP